MAETSAQPNNQRVKYRGKEIREMPSTSQAQSRAMHAAAEGKSTLGIPKKVGKEFVSADHGRKIGKLPKHIKHAAKRGKVSESALKKHYKG